MILIDENLREIIRDSEEKRVGLHMSAIEFQRDILEFNYGIERNFGVRYLSALPMRHGDDGELLDAAKNFMYAAMQSYVEGLKLRKRLRGDTLRSAGLPMTRMDIMEFLEGCNALSK